jgi:hypothetical protein
MYNKRTWQLGRGNEVKCYKVLTLERKHHSLRNDVTVQPLAMESVWISPGNLNV